MNQPVRKTPFKLFPINKSNDGKYSYFDSSPIITFEFNQNLSRLITSSSLRLCGKFKVFNNNDQKQLPANRFDLNGSANASPESYEQVAYIDDRIAVQSVIESVSVSNMRGNMLEQAKNYNRNMASFVGATSSYKNLCSYDNMLFTSTANNDVMARECSSEIEFALPFKNGYFSSNPGISLESGLQIKVNLAADAQVLFGLSAQNFVYQLENLFLAGDYLELAKPVKGLDEDYSAYYNFQNVMSSGNDHQNLNINLRMVNTLYNNFLPSAWTNNFGFSGFSTATLLNNNAGVYSVADIKRYNFNRGAVRYPANYEVNEVDANRDDVFQAFRSRKYLNAIFPYAMMENAVISPDTEKLKDLVDLRTDFNNTPQACDQGLYPKWVFNATGNGTPWSKSADQYEKAANVYGLGNRLDALFTGESADYSGASLNYNIESELDNTSNNVFIYALASTELMSDKMGNVVAIN